MKNILSITVITLCCLFVFIGCSHEKTEVLIQPGTLQMGNAEGTSNEKPDNPVAISRPYYMQTTEVTVEEFERFVQQTGYRTYAQRKKGLKVKY